MKINYENLKDKLIDACKRNSELLVGIIRNFYTQIFKNYVENYYLEDDWYSHELIEDGIIDPEFESAINFLDEYTGEYNENYDDCYDDFDEEYLDYYKVIASETRLVLKKLCRHILRENGVKNDGEMFHSLVEDNAEVKYLFSKYASPSEILKRYFAKNGIDENITVAEFIGEGNYKKIKKPNLVIPENIADLFPEARKMNRHFILDVGPTNSGKTHDAIADLEKAESGVYLAPLRLLAEEVFDTINNDGIKCSLLTGEEKINKYGNIYSATVEMADFHRKFDVAVIDECQMCADPSRGGAWTNAILGIQAERIHLILAPQAVDIIEYLIDLCGDTYEIVQHERLTELCTDVEEISSRDDIREGDACIVFSRYSVHAAAEVLENMGFSVSRIYGALPVDVRRKEAEDFANGKTQIVVATDSIGMGMNLPVSRIVFLEDSKFDGFEKRPLHADEIQQIAGRAGRYGIFDIGYVASLENAGFIKSGLTEKVPQIEKAVVSFPSSFGYDSLSLSLAVWNHTKINGKFVKEDETQMEMLAKIAERYFDDYKDVLKLASMPFNANNRYLYEIWENSVESLYNRETEFFEDKLEDLRNGYFYDMQNLESAYKDADLLYLFADRYNVVDSNEVADVRNKISERITKILTEKKIRKFNNNN